MAKASKWFCLIILWLYYCQLIARYEQFLWCYSQNSRLISRIGKKHTQIPVLIPKVLLKHTYISTRDIHIPIFSQIHMSGSCAVIHQMVLLHPKSIKVQLKYWSIPLNFHHGHYINIYKYDKRIVLPSHMAFWMAVTVLLTKRVILE